MLDENPMLRRRDVGPAARSVRDSAPSSAAQARLSDALRDRAAEYQQGAAVDLTIMEALLRLDRAEDAVQALESHRAALHAMARDMQVVVADAAVEREAEAVCSAVEHAEAPRPATWSNVRRRALALTGAAAVLVALVLPTARFAPRTTLTSFEDRGVVDDIAAARERLEAARSWARVLRENMTTQDSQIRTAAPSRSSAKAVQAKVRTILAADVLGGSAAQSVQGAAEVIDLDARRSRRAAAVAAAAQPQPPSDDPPPPDDGPGLPVPPAKSLPVDVPDAGGDLSPSKSPIGGTAPVDGEDVEDVADVEDAEAVEANVELPDL